LCTFNRTNVELKFIIRSGCVKTFQTFNRTNVELKFLIKILFCVSI